MLAAFGPERTLILRPGLIVSPYDPTDRFTYWPLRFARGGDVLVPDAFDMPVQYIDVRDPAAFVVDAIESGHGGIVNTAGPPIPTTLGAMLEAFCHRERFARERRPGRPRVPAHVGGEPWRDLPVWSEDGYGYDGITRTDPSRALALVLRHHPLAETIADTLRWAQHERGDAPLKAGLTPEREVALFALAAHESTTPPASH